MPRGLLSIFLAAALHLMPAAATTTPDPLVETDTPADWSPDFSEEDRKLILQGQWWDLHPSALPDISEIESGGNASPAVPSSLTDTDENPDPSAHQTKTVHERFLPQYINKTSGSLIDPQKFLNEIEHDDIVKLIGVLEQKYGINIYVSIFAPGQTVPPEINAPTLARQIFGDKHPCLLLHVHYGEVTSLQIACDAKLMEQMKDQGRRNLLAKIKENASLYTNAQDSLIEAVASLAILSQPEAADILNVETPPDLIRQQGKVPEVPIEFVETEKKKKSHLGDLIKLLGADIQKHTLRIVVAVAALLVILIGWIWRRNIKPVKLLPSASDKRLGAPYGAGVGSIVGYGDKNESNPESLSRRQMRDHLRDIT